MDVIKEVHLDGDEGEGEADTCVGPLSTLVWFSKEFGSEQKRGEE